MRTAVILEQFEPPDDAVPAPVVEPDIVAASPQYPANIGRLIRRIATVERENAALRAERDVPPVWLPLKLAAYRAEVKYDRARSWCAKNWVRSTKDGARILVDVNQLMARRDRLMGIAATEPVASR